jgi:hypothetical protein
VVHITHWKADQSSNVTSLSDMKIGRDPAQMLH